MTSISKLFLGFALGAATAYVASRVARDAMDRYREFHASRDLTVDYQAMHAEEGQRFPGPVTRRTARHDSPARLPYSR